MTPRVKISNFFVYAISIMIGAVAGVLAGSLVIRTDTPYPNAGDGMLAAGLLFIFVPIGGAFGMFTAYTIVNWSSFPRNSK
jgi:hypothetical protein